MCLGPPFDEIEHLCTISQPTCQAPLLTLSHLCHFGSRSAATPTSLPQLLDVPTLQPSFREVAEIVADL